jgi:hypothetical protein
MIFSASFITFVIVFEVTESICSFLTCGTLYGKLNSHTVEVRLWEYGLKCGSVVLKCAVLTSAGARQQAMSSLCRLPHPCSQPPTKPRFGLTSRLSMDLADRTAALCTEIERDSARLQLGSDDYKLNHNVYPLPYSVQHSTERAFTHRGALFDFGGS